MANRSAEQNPTNGVVARFTMDGIETRILTPAAMRRERDAARRRRAALVNAGDLAPKGRRPTKRSLAYFQREAAELARRRTSRSWN